MIPLSMIGAWQLFLILFILGLGILPPLIALIDILKNEFYENNKLIWVLVVLFASFFGAVLYFLIGRKQKIASNK